MSSLRRTAFRCARKGKEKNSRVREERGCSQIPYCDYVLTPIGEWRYAFTKNAVFSVETHTCKVPFSRTNPPVTISAELSRVKWNYEKGYDLIASKRPGRIIVGGTERIKMQPNGATNLRITVMSLVGRKIKSNQPQKSEKYNIKSLREKMPLSGGIFNVK